MYKKKTLCGTHFIKQNVKNVISINNLFFFYITLLNWIHNDHKENMNKQFIIYCLILSINDFNNDLDIIYTAINIVCLITTITNITMHIRCYNELG